MYQSVEMCDQSLTHTHLGNLAVGKVRNDLGDELDHLRCEEVWEVWGDVREVQGEGPWEGKAALVAPLRRFIIIISPPGPAIGYEDALSALSPHLASHLDILQVC